MFTYEQRIDFSKAVERTESEEWYKESTGCWEWTGEAPVPVRMAWEMYHETTLPETFKIVKCRNRKCVNPNHMEVR